MRVTVPANFPKDVLVTLPDNSQLPESEQHFLIFLPWSDEYLDLIPKDFRSFYSEILPLLSARTTDVHTAVCMQYLNEFIAKAESTGKNVNRNVLAYALMLHDSGWSQMTEQEIAYSLGVLGLRITNKALAPKEKHAILGEQNARRILTEKQDELGLTNSEIELICKAILFHDKPEAVAGAGNEMPTEVQLLVDLDHVWSFTHLNFWQDTIRKGVIPIEYLENLRNDLDSYFVTDIGKNKAKELLAEREKEVKNAT
ncbi:MAG: hypothetical protein BroJett025_08070 [Patescibacteria group bacterium]|nr:MAG: hypothetical protein BroJett025_08070 [Patescibacteria group bacterium]